MTRNPLADDDSIDDGIGIMPVDPYGDGLVNHYGRLRLYDDRLLYHYRRIDNSRCHEGTSNQSADQTADESIPMAVVMVMTMRRRHVMRRVRTTMRPAVMRWRRCRHYNGGQYYGRNC